MMRSIQSVAAFAVVSLAGPAFGQSVPVAEFANPSSDPVAAPVFTFDGSTFTAGWVNPGLLLTTVGLPFSGDFADAKFTMTPLGVTGSFGFGFNLAGGVLSFVDSSNNSLLDITFNQARLFTPIGAGASDFVGDIVTMSGPLMNNNFTSWSGETFNFSFSAFVGTPTNFNAVGSFTSSAVGQIIPAPSALALMGLAGAVAARRRRN
jgi:hypothetical protein